MDDLIAGRRPPVLIAIGPATSTDGAYNGLAAPSVSVTNADNESVGGCGANLRLGNNGSRRQTHLLLCFAQSLSRMSC
ncbi:MAG: hypothetical protein IPK60_16830 [Sandaracinaceae bacterium]|nr:hypothetical protein [Sandaracinaceae bacterium]